MLDRDFKGLFDLFDFLAFASLASVGLLHNLALAFALTTLLGSLGVHAWAELNELFDDSPAFAFGALFDVFTSLTITGLAVAIPFDLYVFHAAVIHVVEGDFDFDEFGFGFSGSCFSATSSEEASKDVSKSTGTSGRASVLDSFLSILVVELSFFGVGEGLISIGEFFKFLGITSFVGVFFEGFAPEGFSDFLSSGFFVDTEEFIVLSGVDLFFLLGRLLFAGHSSSESSESAEAWESS